MRAANWSVTQGSVVGTEDQRLYLATHEHGLCGDHGSQLSHGANEPRSGRRWPSAVTQEWWQNRRSSFEVYISQLVIQEAGQGDPDAAERRLAILADLPLLDVTTAAVTLTEALVGRGVIPKRSGADALHISIAAVHGVEYLLTWNMAHIANAELAPRIARVCRQTGFEPPVLCTPEQLMGY